MADRRAVRRVGLAAAAGLAAAVGVAIAGRRARPGGSVPTEIAPGVFCIGPSGWTQTNVYLVQAGTTWMLVDAGWAGDTDRIAAAVGQVVGSDTMPGAIVLTHVHPDHAGAARALAGRWRCPVLVHPAELPIARGEFDAMVRFAGPLDRRMILPLMRAIGSERREAAIARSRLIGVVRPLDLDGTIPGLDGWARIATPGHTPGHISLVRTADRVVLTGDALVTLRVNAVSGFLLGRQGLSGPPWYTTWDGPAARASIRAIAALRPAVIGGGHGRPLVGLGVDDAVAAFAEGLDQPAGGHPRT